MQERSQFLNLVNSLEGVEAFCDAHEDGQVLTAFVTHQVCERTGASASFGDGSTIVRFSLPGSRNRFPAIIERLNKKSGKATISVALKPEDAAGADWADLLVPGRFPYMRVRTDDLDSEQQLADLLVLAIEKNLRSKTQ